MIIYSNQKKDFLLYLKILRLNIKIQKKKKILDNNRLVAFILATILFRSVHGDPRSCNSIKKYFKTGRQK